ncbi:MAG: bifunctional [glutamate--ammonia ligase]-adenylyl-L-tyrosine phosphorylase/[glutamate--ammonia-ligase] adenylyltransferase [Xanthomonadaceae bacterium]|nr:bifunctional [glutamate--ammonia ligase]-adenylyl-L-tyrosine phosphorylase/[glutamate--ammonia-ligase] adenylyltransferase [Xanthomonadaceae bacterium]
MTPDAHPLPPELHSWLLPRRARLAELGVTPSANEAVWLDRVLIASDFAFDTLQRWPALWSASLRAAPRPSLQLPADAPAEWPARLRQHRVQGALALLIGDVIERDSVDATLRGCSELADTCIGTVLSAVQAEVAQRYGWVRDRAGLPQSLVVFALGKLGGGELNFSSDVDLVFAYPEPGSSDGARALDAEAWFVRVGQRLIQLLDEVTVDGFGYRVDMRLRPFGSSGRLALPFAAMEQYYQHEGRDWERYAWIKARPAAGDLAAGAQLLANLRPFVYRRYLDYGALDGLREMKAMIAAEVARRELAEHVKLGPGGIRELEFLVQALQLVRAGREPALRQRGLLDALTALAAAGHFTVAVAQRLAAAYRFLRRLENRLQMQADQQVHQLPEEAFARSRLALGLGFPDWSALYAALGEHRAAVGSEFDRLLAPRRRAAKASALERYWRALPGDGDVEALAEAGFADANGCDAALRQFAAAPVLRALSASARVRLDRVLPALLHAAGSSHAPDVALPRLLDLLAAIARRSSYLALLEEQPAALARLVDVIARSTLLSDRLAQHPLLLDELLDSREVELPSAVDALRAERERLLSTLAEDDTEERLRVLNEFRHGVSFRIALAALASRQPATQTARQLAWLAQAVVEAVLLMATREVAAQHGPAPGAGMAAIGYGSFGGAELGFASDLDLVFLYDAPADALSSGPRPLEAPRWYAKVVQKVVNLLAVPTPAGRLYETDLRLRPDGAGGLLVSSVDSFAAYQRERAWVWEQQALVRARPVAGAAVVMQAFERIRQSTLVQPRESESVDGEVVRMRQRMRAERDRSRPTQFDLKHGEGGLVDLEFALQAAVLAHASAHPELLVPRASDDLIAMIAAAGIWTRAQADALRAAHEFLLTRTHECTLDRRTRMIAPDAALDQARAAVRAGCRALGLDFADVAS